MGYYTTPDGTLVNLSTADAADWQAGRTTSLGHMAPVPLVPVDPAQFSLVDVVAADLNAKVDAALTALAAFQTANATARTQLATAKAAATTKSTGATVTTFPQAQTEVRNIYSSVVTALGQLDAALAALDTATRATATALRLTAGRTDDITGT